MINWTYSYRNEREHFRKRVGDAAVEKYYEVYDQLAIEILEWLRRTKGCAKRPWVKVSRADLRKVWFQYGRYHGVRDEQTMLEIRYRLVHNIAEFDIFTTLSGHSPESIADFCERTVGWPVATVRWFEAMLYDEMDWCETVDGDPLITDSALPPLFDLAANLLMTDSAEEMLWLCDRVLNICHQRSDLSQLFIEGGFDTLEELLTEQGLNQPLAV